MREFKDEIRNSVEALKKDGIILYPTDTIWGIGCDATSETAVRKIFSLKQRDDAKSFILLVDHESRLQSYVKDVPEQAWTLIEYSEKPLTIIYDGGKNLPAEVLAPDGSVAIRVTRDQFCIELIRALRKPIVSTSANISGTEAPASFVDIEDEIKNGVDYVVNHRQHEIIEAKPSTIIRLKTGGQITFIRK